MPPPATDSRPPEPTAPTPVVRAARFAALADPGRLRIVDELTASDRSPVELQHRLGMSSNLLAHHLEVLERARLVVRVRSSGDRRRRYVQLRSDALTGLLPGRQIGRAHV